MYTIDAESFTENTRNDSYIIIEKSKKTGVLISYAKYLLMCDKEVIEV